MVARKNDAENFICSFLNRQVSLALGKTQLLRRVQHNNLHYTACRIINKIQFYYFLYNILCVTLYTSTVAHLFRDGKQCVA